MTGQILKSLVFFRVENIISSWLNPKEMWGDFTNNRPISRWLSPRFVVHFCSARTNEVNAPLKRWQPLFWYVRYHTNLVNLCIKSTFWFWLVKIFQDKYLKISHGVFDQQWASNVFEWFPNVFVSMQLCNIILWPHLWSQTLSSDQKKEITNTGRQMSFIHMVAGLNLKIGYRVRTSRGRSD